MTLDIDIDAAALAASPGVLPEPVWQQLFHGARSNTHFADREVPTALVREVFDRAKLAPTGNNAVPMRLVVAESPAARAAVIAHASPGNKDKLERAPLILVIARDDRYHDQFHVTSPGADHVRERLEAAADERSQKAHDGTWLQAGYLILALRAAGLAVRPYGGFSRPGIDEALLAGTSWSSEMLLGVGYPPEGDHGAGLRRGRTSWDDAALVL